jgi:hypothetical protein
MAPDLRRVRIKSENALTERIDDARQPGLETSRLVSIAPVADEFDATAQLAHRNSGKKHRFA